MKHYVLYKLLSFIENVIVFVIVMACIIVLMSVPIGNYTIQFIILKLIAMIVLVLISKVEGLLDE